MAGDSFSILSFLAGPALLTNATSVLLLGTINRYGRSLDRARLLARQMQETEAGSDPRAAAFLARQLDVAQSRVLLMVRTLTLFYVAVAAFGVATMAYLIGAALGAAGAPEGFATIITLVATVLGVLCLALGTLAMAHEGRLSYRILRDEAEFARERRS